MSNNRMNRLNVIRMFKRTCFRLYEDIAATAFIARHPRELARLPRWRQEKNAGTLTLRLPFWPYSAIEWIAAALPPRARVFEYGGGGSTVWLEDRGAILTVAEHDGGWHRELTDRLAPGTTLLFRPPASVGSITSAVIPGYFDDYVGAIDGQPDGSLDLAIVDGRARVECVSRAMPKVKPGGLLLFDDANRLRYRLAVKGLAGWERHVFTGLKPGQRHPAYTSVWKRPG
jgi:hypothetical protein